MNDNDVYNVLPTDEHSLKDILSVMQTMSDSKLMIKARREQINEDRKAICKEYNIPPKLFNKIFSIFHSQNFEQVTAENEVVESAYQRLARLSNKNPV